MAKNINEIREVLSIINAYHNGDVCAKTLRYMGIEAFCKGDETVIRKRPNPDKNAKEKEIDVQIKVASVFDPDVKQIIDELGMTILETPYEKGSCDEIADVLDLAKGVEVNGYAKWRIVDLVTPLFQKYYHKKYDENHYSEQSAPYSMEEMFNECVLVVFKIIDEYTDQFLGLLKLRLKAVPQSLNQFYNSSQKITVWQYIREVDEYVSKTQIETGVTPTVSQISEALGYTESRVNTYLGIIARELYAAEGLNSVEANREDNDKAFQSELYNSGHYIESAENVYETENNAGMIGEVIDSLETDVEKAVIRSKFGFDDCLTLKEIRAKYHVKKADIEIIYDKAMAALAEKLKDFEGCNLV